MENEAIKSGTKKENINLKQKELLVEYILQNKFVLLSSNANRFQKNIKWDELKDALNAYQPPSKDVQKWKRVSFLIVFNSLFRYYKSFVSFKVWQDLRKDVVSKQKKIRAHSNQTGGGPQIELKLSTLDQKIFSIIGDGSIDGDPQLGEIGFQNLNSQSKFLFP